MVLSVECGATNTNVHHSNDRLNVQISQTLQRSNPRTTLSIFESPVMYSKDCDLLEVTSHIYV